MSVITPIEFIEAYPPSLITLEELKNLLQITDDSSDVYFEAAILAASSAVVKYTERNFGTQAVTEQREYQYDGTGILDIDDCTDVTGVALVVPGGDDLVLPTTSWSAQPPQKFDTPVSFYLLLPTVGGWPSVSPQMGFTYNLDRFFTEFGRPSLPQIVKVTATWGWPLVPADVKQAVAWIIDDWNTRVGDGESLASHSIESFSESWQRGTATSQAMAIPSRARDILSQYERHQV